MKKLLIFILLYPFLYSNAVEQVNDNQVKSLGKESKDSGVRTVDEIVKKIDNQIIQAEDNLFNKVLRVKGKFHKVIKNKTQYEVELNCMKSSFFDIMNLGILCMFDLNTTQRGILKKLSDGDVIVVKGKLVDEDHMVNCVIEEVRGSKVKDGYEMSIFDKFTTKNL